MKLVLEEDKYKSQGSMTSEASFCYNKFQEYSESEYRKKMLDEITEARKAYRGELLPMKNPPWEDSSNKSMGLTTIAVDKLEPRIFNKLIAEDNFIQVDPVEETDVDKIEPVTEFAHWALIHNMKARKKIKPLCHNVLKDGTCYVIYPWFEKDKITRRRGEQAKFIVQATGQEIDIPDEVLAQSDPDLLLQALYMRGIVPAGSKAGYEEHKIKEFRVNLHTLKIEDTFWPDHNDDWDDQPFFRYIYPTLGELIEGEKEGVYSNISEKLITDKRELTDTEQERGIQYSDYDQTCKLLECYVKWKNEWKIFTFSIHNGWSQHRNEKLIDVFWFDHKPVKRFRIYPESDEQLGRPIHSKIKYFHDGINELYNAMIDNAKVEVTPYGFYNESSTGMSSNKKIKLQPGKYTGIPKDSNMHHPNIGVKSVVYESFINLLMTFFERTLSIMDYSAGTRSKSVGAGGDTASGMNMILQEGNIAHNYTGESLQDTFGEMLTDIISLYAQNMPIDAKMRLKQNNKWLFKTVDVASLQGKFDISIDVSDASSNTMTNRNDALTLSQVLMSSPLTNQEQIIKDILTAFNKKNTDQYIKPEFAMIIQALAAAPELAEQLQQFIQQYMQQKQQQEQQAKLTEQAQNNVLRSQIQDKVDEPYENQKIVEEEDKKFKKKQVGKVIEMMGGLREPSIQQGV